MIKNFTNFFSKNNEKNAQGDSALKADKGLFSHVKYNQNSPKPHQEPGFFSGASLSADNTGNTEGESAFYEHTRIEQTPIRAINLNNPYHEGGESADFTDQEQARDLRQALDQADKGSLADSEEHIYAGPGEPLDPDKRRLHYQHLQEQTQKPHEDSAPVYYVGADAPRINPASRNPGSTVESKAEDKEEHDEGPVYLIGPSKKAQERAEASSSEGPIYYAGAFGPKMRDTLKNPPSDAALQSRTGNSVPPQEQSSKRAVSQDEELMQKTSRELAGIAPAPIDMLEGYNQDLESDSHYDETPPAPRLQKLPMGLQVKLYIRQFIAAFFTHTTLNVLLPRVSLKLGPCYPSSMPIPYFVIGLVVGSFPVLLKDYVNTQLAATLAFVFFSTLTGLIGYRGMVSLCAKLACRRPDTVLQSVVIFLFMLTFIALLDAVVLLFPPSLKLSLGFGAVFMIAACAATSFNFGLKQDLMDFYGSLSFAGLCFALLSSVLVSFLLLTPMMATSLWGVALLFRALLGQLLYLGHSRASRSLVTGCGYLILLLLLADLLFFAPSLGFLRESLS